MIPRAFACLYAMGTTPVVIEEEISFNILGSIASYCLVTKERLKYAYSQVYC